MEEQRRKNGGENTKYVRARSLKTKIPRIWIKASDYPACPSKTRINHLKTKGRLLYLKTQFVPPSKHFLSRL